MNRYDQAAADVRAPLPAAPKAQDYVRYATLAANSHNTQPWAFRISADDIDILPDFTRRTPAVDPDDHHLFVSLGCAAENMVVAANASGRRATARVLTDAQGQPFVRVHLGQGARTDEDLCHAIPLRQSTKTAYDGTALTEDEMHHLQEAAARDGVDVAFITERSRMQQALAFIQAGNTAQIHAPDFVAELKSWIRFSRARAIATADGLSGPTTGNPSTPEWLGPLLFRLMFTARAENRKLEQHITSSAGLVVFTGAAQTPESWINVGRSFERFALRATAMGLCHAHVNMPIEVAGIRPEFAQWLGMADSRPDLVIRIGRGTAMPMSLRRPVGEVIV